MKSALFGSFLHLTNIDNAFNRMNEFILIDFDFNFIATGRMATVLCLRRWISINVGAKRQLYCKWSNCHSLAVHIFEQFVNIIQCLLSPCQNLNGNEMKKKTILIN